VDDPHRQAQVLGVGQGLEAGVAQPDGLRADPLDPQVRVLAAEVDRAGERGLGQGGQRQREEGLVHGAGLGCHRPCLPGAPDRALSR
jgi:hypothetical protein